MFSLLFVTCAIFVELFQGIFTFLNDKMNPDGAHFGPHIANMAPRYTNIGPREPLWELLGTIWEATWEHFWITFLGLVRDAPDAKMLVKHKEKPPKRNPPASWKIFRRVLDAMPTKTVKKLF